jgi:hypothetical protein
MPAGLHDNVHLAAVQRNHFPVTAFYICAGDGRHVVSQSLAGPAQDVVLFVVAQEVHVAGVHVHRVQQAGAMRRHKVALKVLDRHRAVRIVGQQRSRDSLYLAARQTPFDQRFDVHLVIPLVNLLTIPLALAWPSSPSTVAPCRTSCNVGRGDSIRRANRCAARWCNR